MITEIDLGSFKAFKELKGLRIAPLTILAGKNSCGKSSILQSLLLLKQSLSSEVEEEALTLDGEYLQYSKLSDICFGLPPDNTAKISFGFNINSSSSKNIGYIYFEIKNRPLANDPKRNGPVVTLMSWSDPKDKELCLIKRWKGEYRIPKKVKIELDHPRYELIGSKFIGIQRFLPKYLIQKVKDNKHNDSTLESITLPLIYANTILPRLATLLQRELIRIQYLGPSRAIPRRAYIHYSESHYDLDPDGGNAAYVFWLRKDEKVKWLNGKSIPLKDAVSESLSILGFTQDIQTRVLSKIVYQLLVKTHESQNKYVTIADVGFGYSQVLPIILRALLAKDNALILFEQPEIHLHPSAKAKLADLFIAFMNTGKRLLIETHSTELINGLQLRVIKEPRLRKKINVAFVKTSPSSESLGSQVEQLTLQSDGMFDQWPEGFCDDSEKLAMEILKASVSKEKKDK